MLSVVMLSGHAECCYAECRYDAFHNPECHFQPMFVLVDFFTPLQNFLLSQLISQRSKLECLSSTSSFYICEKAGAYPGCLEN